MQLRVSRSSLAGAPLGAFAAVAQAALTRESLALGGGNELAIGVALCAWLLGIGCGALLPALSPRPAAHLTLGAVTAPFLVALALFGLRFHLALLGAEVGGAPPLVTELALLAALVCGASATIGYLFTAAARHLPNDTGASVSALYTAEAVGALVGGLAFTLAVLLEASHLATLACSGALLTAALAHSGRLRGRIALYTLGGLELVVALSGAAGRADQAVIAAGFRTTAPGARLVASADSPYGRLAITELRGEHQLFADGRFQHAFPDPYERPIPVHLALAEHPHPRRLLIIGGGASDRIEAALEHNLERVVLIQTDARAHTISAPFFPPATRRALADPRVEVALRDARGYLADSPRAFDVVLIDAPAACSSGTNRYHTREFFAAVRQALALGGSMTARATGGANVLAPEALAALANELATVHSVFPEIVLTPGESVWIHCAFAPGVTSGNAKLLARRHTASSIGRPRFLATRFAELIEPRHAAALTAALAKVPGTLATDAQPSAYLLALGLWQRTVSVAGDASADVALGTPWYRAALVLALPLGVWALFQVRGRRRNATRGDLLFAMATTGAAGLTINLLVLYAFQAASGRLYLALSAIVALFMAGIALGAKLGRRWLAGGSLGAALCADLTLTAVLLGSGPVVLLGLAEPWLLPLWSIVSGAVTGAAFPALLLAAARLADGDERRAAATIEAADHFGAAFGALVTGLVLLPALGVIFTPLAIALLKAASLTGLWRARRHGQTP